jgi:magnesium chelatase accessory protein
MVEMMEGAPPQIIGINAALEPFDGLAGVFFPIIAKTIAALPLAADFFSATTARGNGVERIIKGTGSNLPAEDLDYYRRLVASRDHVNATLRMMAQWNLEGLLERLPQLDARTLFIVGDRDKAVPPAVSVTAANRMPNASCTTLPGLGHLAHEEDAEAVAALVLAALDL